MYIYGIISYSYNKEKNNLIMETCISIRLNPNNVHHPKRINSPDLEANENHTLDGEILPYRKNASTLEELGEIKQ